jgi:hypothetical protein
MSHDVHITARCSDENPDEAHYTISFPQEWGDAVLNALAARGDPRPDVIIAQLERHLRMSATLQSDTTALTAAVSSLVTNMGSLASEVTASVAELGSVIASGGSVTAADLAPIEAATAAINTAATDAATATANLAAAMTNTGTVTSTGTVAPTPTASAIAFNATDTTPNSAGGRNTPNLPNYNPAVAETD